MATPTQDDLDAAMAKTLHAESVTVSGKTIKRMSASGAVAIDKYLKDSRIRAAKKRPFLAGVDMSGAL